MECPHAPVTLDRKHIVMKAVKEIWESILQLQGFLFPGVASRFLE